MLSTPFFQNLDSSDRHASGAAKCSLLATTLHHWHLRCTKNREYVSGIYRNLGLDETQVRKLQTGGPDGDIGSKEILLGKEKYVAVVDGAGVLDRPACGRSDWLLDSNKSAGTTLDFDYKRRHGHKRKRD